MGRRDDHYLLDVRAGWRAALLEGVTPGEGCLRLLALPGAARPLADAAGSFGGLAEPTGLALDAGGALYLLDRAGPRVRRYDPCAGAFVELPCVGGEGAAPRRLRAPRGLAIGCGDSLYIADTGNRRVQVFSLKGLALRAIWGPWRVRREGSGYTVAPARPARPAPGPAGACAPEPAFPEGTWQPWDIAVAPDGWAYVSDREAGLVHALDPAGRWRFASDGRGPGSPPLAAPTALALDSAGRLYVAQDGREEIVVLDRRGALLERVARPAELRGRFCPVALAVDQAGNLVVSDRASLCLYVYCRDADGCLTSAGPCPSFGWGGGAVAFDPAGNLLAGDAAGQVLASLTPRAAYVGEGRYYSAPLDSAIYRCQWHRVELEAALPAGTRVHVATLSADVPLEPEELRALPEERWATGASLDLPGERPWDCLVQSPPGRYLWLRLSMAGDGAATPTVSALRVHFPRRSSLQYLPAVYSADEASAAFLERFLSIFDAFWHTLGGRLDRLAALFEPMATPAGAGADFLSWLAGWLGLTLERHWPLERRRLLLKHAHRLYALRGTPEGLRLHLELYSGHRPALLEHYQLRRWLFLNHGRLGDSSALWGAAVVRRLQLDQHATIGEFQLVDSGDPLRDPFHHYAHQFSVFFPAALARRDEQRQALERIIALAAPAHALGTLQLVEPRLRIGVQSCVGIDTLIGAYPDGVVAGASRLGHDSVLSLSEDERRRPTLRVGLRTRIGAGTRID